MLDHIDEKLKIHSKRYFYDLVEFAETALAKNRRVLKSGKSLLKAAFEAAL